MQEDSSQSIRQMVERIPRWLRTDLSSTDPMLRGRAEDALSAMIITAIDTSDATHAPSLPVDDRSAAQTTI